jgi:hypothetical protein
MATALGYTERSSNMVKRLPSQPPTLPADTEGRPLEEGEYAAWWEAATERYAQAWMDRGASPELARTKARASQTAALPEGAATPGVCLNALVHEGQAVAR